MRHPNIYTDTAGVRRFDLLEAAAQRAGARKLLFGTDGPWLHPGVELAKVRALHLSAAEEREVLGGTILRLMRSVRAPQLPPRLAVTTDGIGVGAGDPWLNE